MSKTVLGVAAIIVVTALILLAMGRTPWCQCGYVSLWSGNIWSSENSQQITDPYSFTHVTHGLIFYWFFKLAARKLRNGLRLLLSIFIESSWEVVENTNMVIDRYREVTMSLDYYGDSVINSVGDIFWCIFGYVLASRFSGRASLVAGFVIESILLILIRDNLFLNILMLLYPIEAIKLWQAGG